MKRRSSLTHKQVWGSIYRIAAAHGYSPSGLAVASGLDPTAFNKSKRFAPTGKPRWPTTETIAKVLNAVGRDAQYWCDHL